MSNGMLLAFVSFAGMVLVRGDSCLSLSERLFVNGILTIVVTATYNVTVQFCWLGKA